MRPGLDSQVSVSAVRSTVKCLPYMSLQRRTTVGFQSTIVYDEKLMAYIGFIYFCTKGISRVTCYYTPQLSGH